MALHDLRTFSVLDNIDTKDFKSKKSPLNIRSDLRRLMSMLNQYFMCRVIFIVHRASTSSLCFHSFLTQMLLFQQVATTQDQQPQNSFAR